MDAGEALVAAGLGLLSLLSLAVSGWVWRLDRRTGEPTEGWRDRVRLPMFPFANSGQPAFSLLLTDTFVFWLALATDADAVLAWSGWALPLLAGLVVTTLRLRWPAFLVRRGRGAVYRSRSPAGREEVARCVSERQC